MTQGIFRPSHARVERASISSEADVAAALAGVGIPDAVAALALAQDPAGGPGDLLEEAGVCGSTLREFVERCSPAVCAATLARVARGFPGARNVGAVPPASTNHMGCWIAELKRSNKAKRQAAIITPEVPRIGGQRTAQQLVHRLAVRAWGTWGHLRRLVLDEWDVSHLCHETRCFRPSHLTVEVHRRNIARGRCAEEERCVCGLTPQCVVTPTPPT